jgi:hypothetical protein
MNTKALLVMFAIAAVAATFAITSMASIEMFSGIGSSSIGPTEAFAQNMTNMTGGNMTNMTG